MIEPSCGPGSPIPQRPRPRGCATTRTSARTWGASRAAQGSAGPRPPAGAFALKSENPKIAAPTRISRSSHVGAAHPAQDLLGVVIGEEVAGAGAEVKLGAGQARAHVLRLGRR